MLRAYLQGVSARALSRLYRVVFVVARQLWLKLSPPTGGGLPADAGHVAREAVGRSEVVSSSKTA